MHPSKLFLPPAPPIQSARWLPASYYFSVFEAPIANYVQTVVLGLARHRCADPHKFHCISISVLVEDPLCPSCETIHTIWFPAVACPATPQYFKVLERTTARAIRALIHPATELYSWLHFSMRRLATRFSYISSCSTFRD